MRRVVLTALGSFLALVLGAGPSLACGALVSPNGTVSLVRTTTLAAYHHGVEHYVTGFGFEGAGAEFGSVVPLPDVPTRVIKAGEWTLQRLLQEVQPLRTEAFALAGAVPAAADSAVVLLKAHVDALDITVIKGGGFAVGKWVKQHGFLLPPDAPEVLDFYARRSPIFAAVKFNPERAERRGLGQGQAIPVHFVIPTDRPWVPLRILGLGAKPSQRIEADVFLLNDRQPAMLPAPIGSHGLVPRAPGLTLDRSEGASPNLLADLRSDRGMAWLPASGMWLSYLQLNERAGDLTYDLAIDPTGQGKPSPIDAGLRMPGQKSQASPGAIWPLWLALGLLAALAVLGAAGRRAGRLAG